MAPGAVLGAELNVLGKGPWEKQGEAAQLRKLNYPLGSHLCHFRQQATGGFACSESPQHSVQAPPGVSIVRELALC